MSEASQSVGEELPTNKSPMNGDNPLPDSFWATDNREFDDLAVRDEGFSGDGYPELVSLTSIRAAMRRKFRTWFTLAVVGFVLGIGLYAERPAGYSATATLLLSQPPNAQQGWIADDQALAQSRTVAGMALRRLGLKSESAALFANAYTVVPLTDRVLTITLKAVPTQADALRNTNAVTAAFLAFRASLLTKQENLDNAALGQEVNAASQQLAGIDRQLAALAPSSPGRKTLEAQRARALVALTQFKQAVTTIEANTQTATSTAITLSRVLDPAALVKASVKRRLALYGGAGLMAGLVLGLGTVVITAVVSTRLRRRDEVARALGAPVRLSIGKVRSDGRALLRRGLAAARDTSLSRVVVHLGGAVAPAPGGFASLAVVPVEAPLAGSVEATAVCVASLATMTAQQGLRVVLADLYSGAPAAGVLGVRDPGISEVTVEGVPLVVVIPDPEDVMLAGPMEPASHGGAAERAKAACASANVVLTLAELDPALGGDYLAGWTRSVVAVVTAGRSSAERIQAVGEMVRLAGITKFSAVLLGADKTDESFGHCRLKGTQQ